MYACASASAYLSGYKWEVAETEMYRGKPYLVMPSPFSQKTEAKSKKMPEEKKGKIRSISRVKGRLQASIPANVLTALHLSEGDELVWTVEGEKAIAVKKEANV